MTKRPISFPESGILLNITSTAFGISKKDY